MSLFARMIRLTKCVSRYLCVFPPQTYMTFSLSYAFRAFVVSCGVANSGRVRATLLACGGAEIAGLAAQGELAELGKKQEMLAAVEQMHESNPMLGLRGVRLSIVMPGIVVMQTRAILRAAASVKRRGIEVNPEIMIPLVGHPNELRTVQTQLEEVAKQVVREQGGEIPYLVGTMIEVPRGALV